MTSSPRTQSPAQTRTQVSKQDDILDNTLESPKLRNKVIEYKYGFLIYWGK